MSQRQLSDMTEGETQGSENDLEEVAVKLGFGKKKKESFRQEDLKFEDKR